MYKSLISTMLRSATDIRPKRAGGFQLTTSLDVVSPVNHFPRRSGCGGGGAEVTAFGILLIERNREVERNLNVVGLSRRRANSRLRQGCGNVRDGAK